MGQERIDGAGAKGELQHLHAGIAKLFLQRVQTCPRFFVEIAQVFGDDRHLAQRGGDGVEDLGAGAIQPPPFDRRLSSAGTSQ